MERKLKDMIKPDESDMLDAVCGSAHQIWQAGLGAFARAQREGSVLFDKLVQEGGELHRLTEHLTGEKGFSVADTVTRLAENASRQASGSLDKLEKVFEQRVSRSLRSLGVPSSAEVHSLSRDMVALEASLGALGNGVQDELAALQREVAGLKAAIGTGARLAARKSLAAPAPTPQAAAKPAAKASKEASTTASKVASKTASKVASKTPAGQGAAAKRSAARKSPRATARPG